MIVVRRFGIALGLIRLTDGSKWNPTPCSAR